MLPQGRFRNRDVGARTISAIAGYSRLLDRMMPANLRLARAGMRELEGDVSICCNAEDPSNADRCPRELEQEAEARQYCERGALH